MADTTLSFERSLARLRDGNTVTAAALRVLLAGLWLAWPIWASRAGGRPDYEARLPWLVVYLDVAVVHLLVVRRSAKARRWFWYTLALVDAPLVCVIQSIGLALAPSPPLAAMFGMGYAQVVVVVTLLSLDAKSIVLAAAIAAIGDTFLLRHGGVGAWATAAMVLAVTALISVLLVRRLSAEVSETAREDIEGG
jgi:hypothetical protein